jgi:hypothetical protein
LLIELIAETFDASEDAARVRLSQLGCLAERAGGPALFT